jgi:tRNA (guanosine-2'-O-)-methyltransferase
MRTLLLFALVFTACGPAAPAKAPGSDLKATKLEAYGMNLVQACTPTGPELCFNAIDDNCNGVIDEGCGSCTGLLQFAIAWGDSPADVDLIVTDPLGARVFEGNKGPTPSGLRLDQDCPRDDGCKGQNVENVCFEGGEPPKGKYRVEIKLGELNGAKTPVEVRFGARIGNRSMGADVSLTKPEESKSFSFEL